MEDLELGSKLYRLKLDPDELLIIEIPEDQFYKRINNVRSIADIAKRMLNEMGMKNPIFIIPDDMSIGKMKTSPTLIEPEPDGFDKEDFTL